MDEPKSRISGCGIFSGPRPVTKDCTEPNSPCSMPNTPEPLRYRGSHASIPVVSGIHPVHRWRACGYSTEQPGQSVRTGQHRAGKRPNGRHPLRPGRRPRHGDPGSQGQPHHSPGREQSPPTPGHRSQHINYHTQPKTTSYAGRCPSRFTSRATTTRH